MNRLSGEKSAYLQHAAHQNIDWHPWSDSAFDKAKKEDMPVFLSSGAVWCHWCHVMAKECFFDNEITEMLNSHFISIKLDRDERPDIDRRYQLAVAAMGSGGGWPLSVFLTPERLPFFGGTYFPPEDRHGRPGFKKVLKAVQELYETKRSEIGEYTDKLIEAIRTPAMPSGEISEPLIDDAVRSVLSRLDPKNGGFGDAPKFPMPGALDFLVNRYYLTGDEAAGHAVRKTLESMALGGMYDQVGGGFHRYATDASWIIPHFEKMADDNAWLLRNYLSAYAVFGDPLYREIAEGTITYVRDVLSDPAGGFFASQDADVTPEDEGGYFTWSEADFSRVLSPEENRVLSLHLLHEKASMHHDPSKKVLFIVTGAQEIAQETGMDVLDVTRLIQSGREKLLRERNKRETPFIDTTFYTSINGMFISVFLLGFRVLKDARLKEFALKSLDRILEMRLVGNELFHTEKVKAFLDDYVCVIDALIAAYEVTGHGEYRTLAGDLMKRCLEMLWDSGEGGFFDTDDHALGIGLKAVEDIPHPSANALAVRVLLKLSAITGRDDYRVHAEKALKAFSTKAAEMGLHAGYYFSSLDAYFNPLKISLHTKPGSALSEKALSVYSPFMDIIYEGDEGYAVPCVRDVCHEPIDSPDRLEDFISRRKRGPRAVRE